jgi:1-phosphofructokinase
MGPPVTVFGPHPLLTIAIEREGGRDAVHVHPGGQGVWAARMAAELGAHPILCGFAGGETGAVLRPLLDGLRGEQRIVTTRSGSGCHVTDRRGGDRALVAAVEAAAPDRHELDELLSVTCAAALDSRALLVCNPFPGDTLPLDAYSMLVANARAAGTTVLVDLSSPRLDSALEGRPDVVKVNDWELAEYIRGPVDGLARRRAAAERLLDGGAGAVIVTRGPEPALVLRGGEARELVPPRLQRGSPAGCGDTMMGALAASLAGGVEWERALRLAAAAGAANFLRHGLGTGSRTVVERLAERVIVGEPAPE